VFLRTKIALNVSTLHYSANSVSFVANSIPIFITVLSGVMLKEKTSLLGWLSLFIGLSGVVILNYEDGFQFELRVLILLIIPLSASIFFILQKPLLKNLEPYEIMVYTIISGSLILILYDHSFIHNRFLLHIARRVAKLEIFCRRRCDLVRSIHFSYKITEVIIFISYGKC